MKMTKKKWSWMVALLGPLVMAGSLSAAPAYPVKAGPTGRYLVDQNGVPFLITGESPQAMIGNLSEAEAELFFSNRRAHGFNTVWINLLCTTYTGCRDDGMTFDGIPPFTALLANSPAPYYDLSTPNEDYFARVDRILQLAAQYGFLVILDPAETGGWLDVLRNNGIAASFDYGRFLGQRYASFDNILWMHGNDYDPNLTDDLFVAAIASGIRVLDTRHLHTLELNRVSTSQDAEQLASLIGLDLDTAYSSKFPYVEVLKAYNHPNFSPTFTVEAGYEFESASTVNLRAQEYSVLLSGAAGQLYGNGYTWPFLSGWQDRLDSPGAVQMGYVTALFEPRAWYNLVPDQAHTVVTGDLGTFGADDYVAAARTLDGTLVMAYVPSIRTLTVDLTQLSGPVTARWYDPSAGTSVDIGGSPFPNSGLGNFTVPGINADGDEDWVLVLEAQTGLARAELTSPAPGSTLPGAGATFNWSAGAGALQYSMSVGTTGPGSFNVYSQGQGTSQSATVVGLPVDGSTVYVRLWTQFGGGTGWVLNDYTYTTVNQTNAVLTSPVPGSALPGGEVRFSWSAGALQYSISVGTTGPGSFDVYSQGQGTSQSVTVSGLPVDGSTVYVRLWTQFGGGTGWVLNDYAYAASAVATLGTQTGKK